MKHAILDVITPLESQNITSITFAQLTDQLRNNPEFTGIEITDALISQAIEGIDGVTSEPDPANNNKMTITMDSSEDAPQALAKTDQGQKKVDDAATRQATKDLGAPDASF